VSIKIYPLMWYNISENLTISNMAVRILYSRSG